MNLQILIIVLIVAFIGNFERTECKPVAPGTTKGLLRTGKSNIRIRQTEKYESPEGLTISGTIERKNLDQSRSEFDDQGGPIEGCGNGRCFGWLFGYGYDYYPPGPPLEYCEEVYDAMLDVYHEVCRPI